MKTKRTYSEPQAKITKLYVLDIMRESVPDNYAEWIWPDSENVGGEIL